MRRAIFLLALFCVSLTAVCQDDENEQRVMIEELDRIFADNIDKLRDLYVNYRSLEFPNCDGFNASGGILDMLNYYQKNSSENATKPVAGLLVYHFSRDTFRVYLCTLGDGWMGLRVSKSEQCVPGTHFIAAENNLRAALKIDALSDGRAIVKRSGRRETGEASANVSLDSAIKFATDLLLPRAVRDGFNGLQHLLVAPVLNIGQFPFALFRPYQNNAYLIDSMSISQVPHLCNFASKGIADNSGGGYFEDPLVVGNPLFFDGGNYYLPPLAGANDEAVKVAKILETEPLLGKEATISAIKSRSKTADLLYFATHGYFDFEKLLDSSFIAFAPDSTNRTGLWTARDIQKHRFEAGNVMAVLSACQTGVGKTYDAGFIGLGRAFFIAGANHTVMSLWSVNDEATEKLMTLFMTSVVNDNLPFYPAHHLRKAILSFRSTRPDPALWAPFTVFGFPF